MMRKALLFVLLLFGGLTLSAEQFDTVWIEQVPQAVAEGGWRGYVIREFRIGNQGAKPAEILLQLYMQEGVDHSATRRLLVPPGVVQNVTLYLPPARREMYEHGNTLKLRLIIDRREWRHSLMNNHVIGGYWNRNTLSMLISGQVPFQEYQSRISEGRHYQYSPKMHYADIPVAQWGTHLRDYAELTHIWISSSDPLPSAVERALMNWVFAGGTLYVIVPPLDAWPGDAGEEPADNNIFTAHHGWGTRIVMRPVPDGWKWLPKATAKENHRKTDESKFALTAGLLHISELLSNPHHVSSLRFESDEIAHTLDVVPPRVPMQTLFFVMLTFVVLIGPVNFFVLKKMRREPLILVTTPAISLLFCLLVVGFITFGEGWYSRAKGYGITLLDQETKQASTRAFIAAYSPIAPRGGFTFDSEDVLRFFGVGRVAANLDRAQHYSAGLLQPRIPLQYSMERVTMQREHLKLTREKDGVNVVNGLGVRLTALQVVTPEGEAFFAEVPIEPGARAMLRRSRAKVKMPANLNETFETFDNKLTDEYDRVNEGRFHLVPRGYYLALTEEAVFWTPGFKPDEFSVNHAVLGKYSFTGDGKDGN